MFVKFYSFCKLKEFIISWIPSNTQKKPLTSCFEVDVLHSIQIIFLELAFNN